MSSAKWRPFCLGLNVLMMISMDVINNPCTNPGADLANN